MQLPIGVTVAVLDGERFSLFRNTGDEANPKLAAVPHAAIDDDHKGSSIGHQSSSANPSGGQADEDGFTVGAADYLNKQVLAGKIDTLIVIAPPRALGELRKHYHKALSAVLRGEIAKELVGLNTDDLEKAIAAA